MKNHLKLFLITLIISLVSCSQNEDNSRVQKISYGTSFGECAGFCKKELIIDHNSALLNLYSFIPSIQTKSCNFDLEQMLWDHFRTNLDQLYFKSLPKVIGCPDCADGGAEWLEVEFVSGKKHKVTFEYQKAPYGIQNYVNSLRSLMEERINCMEK